MNLLGIYDELFGLYGPQGWWPLLSYPGVNPTKTGSARGYHPGDYFVPRNRLECFEICVGAVLTQNTAWPNVEKALLNLEAAGALSPEGILSLSLEQLCAAIRPAGYFNQKAERLRVFSSFFQSLGDGIPFREELLSLKGVGPETADSMLLYAFKVPSFVVDAYTKRIFSRIGLIEESWPYDKIKKFFEGNLPCDLIIYQEFHALIVEHAKRFHPKKNASPECPLCKRFSKKRSLKRTP